MTVLTVKNRDQLKTHAIDTADTRKTVQIGAAVRDTGERAKSATLKLGGMTGKVVVGIGGETLHSVANLPVGKVSIGELRLRSLVLLTSSGRCFHARLKFFQLLP